MTRQYIGARYVPIFFDGAQGTEWLPNTQYEPLTIVTRNGNSYTSKKAVPAAIGAPENNAAYWASTGIYNQQVEELRQDVLEYKNEMESAVETFETRADDLESQIDDVFNLRKGFNNVILVSDSYGSAVATGGPSWIDRTIRNFEGTGKTFSSHWKGGTGFGWPISNELYFPNFFQTFETNENADLVIILCGANDGNLINQGDADETAIISGITAGVNILRSKYPNALIKLGFVGRHLQADRVYQYYRANCAYIDGAHQNGIEYLKNSNLILYNRQLVGSAELHPTPGGSEELAKYARSVIMDEYYDFRFAYRRSFASGISNYIEANESEVVFTVDSSSRFIPILIDSDMPYLTEHTYSGFNNQWFYPCRQAGASQTITIPYTNTEDTTFFGTFNLRIEGASLIITPISLNGSTGTVHVKTIFLPKTISFKSPIMLA